MALTPYGQKSEFYDKVGSWCLGGTCLLAYIFIATTWFHWGTAYHNQLLKTASYQLMAIPGIPTIVCAIASKRFELKAEDKSLSSILPWN